jgi:hypothetical protein
VALRTRDHRKRPTTLINRHDQRGKAVALPPRTPHHADQPHMISVSLLERHKRNRFTTLISGS